MGARRDLGVSLVGYALVLGLLVTTAVGSITLIESASTDEINNQANCVSQRPPPVSCQPRTVTTTTTTTTPGPTTTTTSPIVPTPVTISVTSVTASIVLFTWQADVVVDVVDDLGNPIAAAEISVRFQAPPAPAETITCTSDATGACTLSWVGLTIFPSVNALVDLVDTGGEGIIYELQTGFNISINQDGTYA